MRVFTFFMTAAVLMLAAGSLPLHAAAEQTYRYEIKPTADDNFVSASFTLLLPGGLKPKADGLVIFVPGWNGRGEPLLNNRLVLDFAARNNCAVLVCSWLGSRVGAFYPQAEKGSGTCLKSAVAHLAADSSHAELTEVPRLIFGHSAGGQFTYHFINGFPDRVCAFAVLKGGFYECEPTPGGLAVPGLFVAGALDQEYRARGITGAMKDQPRGAARWLFALEPDSGHGMDGSLALVIRYFDAVLAEKTARTGYFQSVRHTSPSPAVRDTQTKVWMPNKQFYQQWKSFQQ